MLQRFFGRYLRLALTVALIATGAVALQSQEAQASVGGITIVASGGAPEGSGWQNTSGVITTSGVVSINAADITSALATGNLEVSAAAITVASNIVWTASTQLTLNSSGSLILNGSIQASGASAGLVMTSTPLYKLSKTSSIQLTGATPTLSINGQAYSVVNTLAQLESLTSSSTYVALGRSIALVNTYAGSFIDGAFSSTFDGLGNEVSGLQINAAATSTTNLGFFAELRGATVRNFGVTNVFIQSTSAVTSNNLRIGALAGSVGDASKISGWSPTAYSTSISNVWSSGSVGAKETAGTDQQGTFFGGGVVGSLNNGGLVVEDSRSSVNVSAAGTASVAMSVGGLIGDASNYPGTGQVHLEVKRCYATGSIVEGSRLGSYYGSGGVVGVTIPDATSTVSNSFSWSSIIATSASSGGVVGYTGGGTVDATYSTYNSYGTGVVTKTNSYKGITPSTWTALPPGFSSTIWGMDAGGGLPFLLDQVAPQLPLYVQVVAPTDGKYTSMSYAIVTALGASVNLASLGLTGPTGTAQYSIDPAVAAGNYSVTYVSGLVLGGAQASSYYLAPYTTPTPVTITSALTAQTVTWSPTNTSAVSSAGQLTPNSAATTSGSGAISYAVNNAGSTGCTVSAANPPVVSFTAAGDCVVRATAAGTATEATAYKDVVFTISVPTPQTVTWSPTNTSAMTTASPLTPSAGASSSGTGAISYAVQSAGTTACTVNASTGQLAFTSAGDCVVRATAAATSTESSAFADVTFTVATSTTSMVISIDIAVGTTVANAPVSFATTGLQPGAGWDLVVRSTPQTLASGSVGSLGAVTGSSALPSGLAPGWHSLTLAGTRVNGGFVSSTVWFEVSSTGDLVATQALEPDQPVEPDVAPAAASEIAHTGFAVAGYVTVAALLVLLGGGTVIARRRNAA